MKITNTSPTVKEAGVKYISTAQLLQIVLHLSDRTREALETFRDTDKLRNATDAELLSLPGIGPAKLKAIRAFVELLERQLLPEKLDTQIHDPNDAASQIRTLIRQTNTEREVLVALFFDTRNRIITKEIISIGNKNMSIVNPGEIYGRAVRHDAAALILGHNHPTGDPSPSTEDIAVTRTMVDAGQLLGIDFLDHIIIGKGDNYVSLREKQLGFEMASR